MTRRQVLWWLVALAAIVCAVLDMVAFTILLCTTLILEAIEAPRREHR